MPTVASFRASVMGIVFGIHVYHVPPEEAVPSKVSTALLLRRQLHVSCFEIKGGHVATQVDCREMSPLGNNCSHKPPFGVA